MRMKFNILKRAFSLTELLIVLVVVAVLFAAMLPIFTKRGHGTSRANEPVWMYVKDDPSQSAYFDPGSSALSSSAYIGFKPSMFDSKPYSKAILRAKTNQNMIQFRIGNDGNGTLAGVFTATPYNWVLGSKMAGDADNNFNTLVSKGTYHTVLGMNAGSKLTEGHTGSLSTTVGASSSMGGKNDSNLLGMVAVGSNSNIYAKAKRSVLVGANTGKTETVTGVDSTVAIGANSLGLPTSSGVRNVFLGYNVAGTGMSETAQGNVVLNSGYYGINPTGSTIVGYQTYESGYTDAHNITAIGYNACASFNPKNDKNGSAGNTTCIGYNTASNTGMDSTTKGLGWESDEYDHIFLGGKPNGAFGGRAVLEIHNIVPKNYSKLVSKPSKVGPTVVLNSHLVVRGNVYIPNAATGTVSAFDNYTIARDQNTKKEQARSHCGRGCLGFGRRKWRNSECKLFEVILSIIAILGSVAAFIATGGASLGPTLAVIAALASQAAYLASGYALGSALEQDGGRSFKRIKDPATVTAPIYTQSAGENTNRCATTSAAKDAYFDRAACPNVLRTSDIRLKDNISENEVAISKILQVNPYYYTFKDDAAKKLQVGVMAQDLEKYFSNAVVNDPDGYKSIRWDEMFFATINSIKALDASVEKMNNDIIVMEDDANDVAKDQAKIKNRIKDIDSRIKKLENN